MDKQFIYVFTEGDCEHMQDMGCQLLYKHKDQDIWVFTCNDTMCFEANDIDCVVSNKLTF